MKLANALKLPIVLVAVSALIAGFITVRFFLVGTMLPAPFVIIAILILLTFTYSRWPRASAGGSLIIAVLVPILVLLGYLNGGVELAVVVFDWVIFLWVILSAVYTLRTYNGGVA
jgi:hypothetical protein